MPVFSEGKLLSVAEILFLLPATILLGPALLFWVFVVLPLGLISARDFGSAISFFEIFGAALGAFLGLGAAWLTKIRGVDWVSRKTWLRLAIAACLALGMLGGILELSVIVTLKQNGALADLFFGVIILPAVLVGAYQLFRIFSFRKQN